MADEALINRLYDIVNQITKLGGEQELTSIVPGILVPDANPSDLPTGYIKIVNPRDGTYVPCLTVSGLVVSDNDLVNVLFAKGTEPIAISQSANSPSTSLKVSEVWESDFGAVALQANATGDIGIGTSGPDAKLDVLSATGVQLRLTHTDGSKFADVTVDTNHDFTIDPSSTGQIILASDDVVMQEDLIHSGDTDTKIIFTDDNIEFQAGGLSLLTLAEAAQDLITLGPGSGDVDIDFNGDMFLQGSTGHFMVGTTTSAGERFLVQGASGQALNVAFFTGDGDGTDNANFIIYGVGTPGSVANRERLLFGYHTPSGTFRFQSEAQGTGTLRPLKFETEGNSDQLYIDTNSNVGISTSATSAQLHVDQASTTGAKPVLYLDQGDVSEEMIEFNTTIGVGNAIEAVGAKTLTTTHFIKVTLPGGLTRYIPVGTIA